eukprot:9270582-Alexandrium_andersonii.AAC.1
MQTGCDPLLEDLPLLQLAVGCNCSFPCGYDCRRDALIGPLAGQVPPHRHEGCAPLSPHWHLDRFPIARWWWWR